VFSWGDLPEFPIIDPTTRPNPGTKIKYENAEELASRVPLCQIMPSLKSDDRYAAHEKNIYSSKWLPIQSSSYKIPHKRAAKCLMSKISNVLESRWKPNVRWYLGGSFSWYLVIIPTILLYKN